MPAFEPEILQDFLTESGELLEQLEGDLVTLEGDPSNLEMINKVFRALHTIKGSASFLALTNLVTIAHAAESALNAARNHVIAIDRAMMDLLLKAVDIVRGHMQQLRAGEDLATPPQDVVAALVALGEGRGSRPAPATAAPAIVEPPAASTTPAVSTTATAPGVLALPPEKADLLEFLITDVDESLAKIKGHLASLRTDADPSRSSGPLIELGESLTKAVEFFDFASMVDLSRLIVKVAEALANLPREEAPALLACADEALGHLESQRDALKAKQLRAIDSSPLAKRLEAIVEGTHPSADTAPTVAPTTPTLSAPIQTPTTAAPTASRATSEPGAKKAEKPASDKASGDKPVVDNTIRVEVGRLETLMNLVGELVLQKNRIAALVRKAAGLIGPAGDMAEAMTLAAGGLDRVTADIQTAVMRTRMQPLDKLFGKYPRLIRDLSAKTGKKMRLVIEGGETEVDKSVMEELGDPLVHLLRNSADHGLEGPDERRAAGKGEEGTITLRASHEGSHVRVQVIDDGRGLPRERIAKKAIEKNLYTQEQLDAMSDREVWNIIFEAGFSTADKVSDLSGRGVGMDVVRTNVQKIKGTIDLFSEPGKGTTITILIPLTIAILPAMMVSVADEIYAIPLGNITEIVKPDPADLSTIGEHPVMRLRDTVLPLVSASQVFEHKDAASTATPFAVVLAQSERRLGLLVSKLIGQQEVVIKPLDDGLVRKGGAISGATVRDDGGVSLIVDVGELMRRAETMQVGVPA